MMERTAGNDPKLVSTQYATSANLDARIRLHANFSTNSYGWQLWVFDHLLALPADASVLEIGCGTGQLWAENATRIPSGWTIVLSDQSPGMLHKASATLAHLTRPMRFAQIDAQQIPYPDASFDAVVANHMLYHVPDLSQVLAEIARVLTPGGTLFAATNGRSHMVGLSDLAGRFNAALQIKRNMAIDSFLLENGAERLASVFAKVTCPIYEDAIVVDHATPLVDYIFSMVAEDLLQPGDQEALMAFINAELQAQGGQIVIEKSTGLFVATKALHGKGTGQSWDANDTVRG